MSNAIVPVIGIAETQADGREAACHYFCHEDIAPHHFTAEGADQWGEPGCNVDDAAWAAFPNFSRHYEQVDSWEDEHWDAFRDAFVDDCTRRAKGIGWRVA